VINVDGQCEANHAGNPIKAFIPNDTHGQLHIGKKEEGKNLYIYIKLLSISWIPIRSHYTMPSTTNGECLPSLKKASAGPNTLNTAHCTHLPFGNASMTTTPHSQINGRSLTTLEPEPA